MTETRIPETLRRAEHLAQRRLGDEVVVMDVRRGTIYGLNPAAGELLEWLKPGRELTALGDGAPDLRAFLAEMLASGLVEEGSAGDAAGSPPPASLAEQTPRLLWREEAARVVNQVSPPQAITNPQCQP